MKHLSVLSLILVLVLTASLLAGCETGPQPGAASTEQPGAASTQTEPPASTAEPVPEFRFTRENFPRLDGSTACLPMAEAICSVLLGESREEVQDLIHFNRTTQSFRNLMGGECDLLLAGQPNAAVFDEMEEGYKTFVVHV